MGGTAGHSAPQYRPKPPHPGQRRAVCRSAGPGGPAPAATLATAREHADAALAGLRAACTTHHIPRGLLSRAWLHAAKGQLAAARALLDEAERIATRGGMHLHRARLFPDRAPLAEARRLIEDCGYGRRPPELADAEQAAQGW